MMRWLVLLAGAASAAGCNNPTCGPGTMQVQQKNGTVQCLPADGMPASIPCDADMGAVIVGGECVSKIQCGPGTSLDPTSNLCISTGSGGGPPACPAPPSGAICINGRLHHFLDDSTLAAGESFHVSVYDPTVFLSGGPPIQEADSTGDYVFPNITVPAVGAIAVGVGKKADTTMIALSGFATRVVAGQSYRIDSHVVLSSTVDGWKSQTGTDFLATGAYLTKFYSDPSKGSTDFEIYETMKVPGVQLYKNGAVAPGVNYFSTSLSTIDGALTATGMEGAAIVPVTSGSLDIYTGMGGMAGGMPINWGSGHTGGSATNVLFIDRFHPM